MQIKCERLINMTQCVIDEKKSLKYLLPFETANFLNRKENYVTEEEIIESSPHRTKIICPKFYQCGGCDFLHIKYDYQQEIKTDYLIHLFKMNRLPGHIKPIISCSEPLHYRHKTVLSATTFKNKLKLGLFQKNSKNIFPFLNCYLHPSKANEVFASLEEILNQYKIKPYDYDLNTGILKHVLIRTSYHTKEMILVIATQGDLLPKAKDIARDIQKKHPLVKTVIQNIHHKKTSQILLEKERIITGKGIIEDEIFGIRFKLSSQSFYQANPIQMFKLYDYAIKQANIQSTDIVLDTYSGIGTLSLLAAKKAKKVYAIESNKQAHLDGITNKNINDIYNVEFILGDVSSIIKDFYVKPDIVIMDPPREGSSPIFLDALLKLLPKKIIYISCEPHALVRDLSHLTSHYHITDIQPFDMFPQTIHVETITLLSLKTL